MKLDKRYLSAVCAAVIMAGALVSCGSYEFPADKIYTLFPVTETNGDNDSDINRTLSPASSDEAANSRNADGDGGANGANGAYGSNGANGSGSGSRSAAGAGDVPTKDGEDGKAEDENSKDGKAGNGGKSADDDKDKDGDGKEDGAKTTTKSTTKKKTTTTTTQATEAPAPVTAAPQQTPAQTQAPQTVYVPPTTTTQITQAQTAAPQQTQAPKQTQATAGSEAPANPYAKQIIEIKGNADQEECLKYVNEERKKLGLSPLILEKDLCKAAEVRCNDIQQLFDHERPNGQKSSKYVREVMGSSKGGENIANGYYNAWEVMYLQEKYTYTDSNGKQQTGWYYGWMYTYLKDGKDYLTSKYSHKANILNPNYKRIGIAFDPTSNNWIQLFYG